MTDTDPNEHLLPEALASATAPDLQIPQGACLIDGIVEPCTLVIIGASGDLTARKIIPALYNLDLQGGLPDTFLIVGCARTKGWSQGVRGNARFTDHKMDTW